MTCLDGRGGVTRFRLLGTPVMIRSSPATVQRRNQSYGGNRGGIATIHRFARHECPNVESINPMPATNENQTQRCACSCSLRPLVPSTEQTATCKRNSLDGRIRTTGKLGYKQAWRRASGGAVKFRHASKCVMARADRVEANEHAHRLASGFVRRPASGLTIRRSTPSGESVYVAPHRFRHR